MRLRAISNIKELVTFLLLRRWRLVAVAVECAIGDGSTAKIHCRLEAVEIVFVDNVKMIAPLILVDAVRGLVHLCALVLGVDARYVTFAESHTLANCTLIALVTCDQCQLAISCCSFRSVVHDAVIVISGAIIVVHRWIHFVEFTNEARFNILPENLYVLIAIGTVVHVNKAESMQKFVHNNAFGETLKSVE